MWCKHRMSQEAPGTSAPELVAQELVSTGMQVVLERRKRTG